jgi:hypothetical protein
MACYKVRFIVSFHWMFAPLMTALLLLLLLLVLHYPAVHTVHAKLNQTASVKHNSISKRISRHIATCFVSYWIISTHMYKIYKTRQEALQGLRAMSVTCRAQNIVQHNKQQWRHYESRYRIRTRACTHFTDYRCSLKESSPIGRNWSSRINTCSTFRFAYSLDCCYRLRILVLIIVFDVLLTVHRR